MLNVMAARAGTLYPMYALKDFGLLYTSYATESQFTIAQTEQAAGFAANDYQYNPAAISNLTSWWKGA